MILYPTETIYALGANVLDESEIQKLYALKGREASKGASWLVRDIADIEKYGELTPLAAKIAEQFLPGSLTLVLRAKNTVPAYRKEAAGEVSFRISTDPIAQVLIHEFMTEHDAPLTCTSANVSGMDPETTPAAIIAQFKTAGRPYSTVNRTIDDGPRSGAPSTVVKVFGDQLEILREGAIPASAILKIAE